jgi:uncharacterized protein (UPF0335 family)
MTDDTGVAGEELRQFVERIEAVEAEIKDRNSDKSEIFKELKGRGFDPAIVRKIVAERRDPDKAAEQRAILELYREALSSRVHVHATDAA